MTTDLSFLPWGVSPYDEKEAWVLSQQLSIPLLIAQILVQRAISIEKAPSFLNPKLSDLLPDPSLLLDIDSGSKRLHKAIKDKETIAVFGDYDVDGACSSAILVDYLRKRGIEPILYIPDRLQEGYGANENAMVTLFEQKATLILMVDCGSTAHKPLQKAHALGMDVIVLDHHACENVLPPGYIINPNRLDQDLKGRTDLMYLCAAGVTFLFLVSVERLLKKDGFFAIDLRTFLDLVALATVCDVMPLLNLNRAFVTQGLKVIEKRMRPGITALLEVSQVSEKVSTYHLGFAMGPRINATGRIARCDLGSCLLSSHSFEEASPIAKELDACNIKRRLIEAQVLEEALESIERQNHIEKRVLVAYGKSWHPGVVGIVASRIKERYNKPAIILSIENEIAKGSGRSISGYHLGQAMHRALKQDILIAGGGHAMAAGLTLYEKDLEKFCVFLEEDSEHVDFTLQKSYACSYLPLSLVTYELVESLSLLEPYGMGHPTPRFIVGPFLIMNPQIIKEKHIRFMMKDPSSKTILKGICFSCVHQAVGVRILGAKSHDHVFAFGTLQCQEWNQKKSISMTVEDVVVTH